MKMRYRDAYLQLDSALNEGDNQVERLVAEVQLMRLCQREAHNKEFYDHYDRARHILQRIGEERGMLSERLQRRLRYAESELHIVASAYYYYVGLEQESIDALALIDEEDIEEDTTQYLNYLYQIGAGGILTQGTADEINQREWVRLMQCYQRSTNGGYLFWQANALQALSEHLFTPDSRRFLLNHNRPSVAMINIDDMPDTLMAGNLAQRSLELFRAYGDVYQTAGAYRTLASCYWGIGDFPSALICLERALENDTAIRQAPDLVASIHERLSLTYSALDEKPRSDEHRNFYLDIQEQTRQDRQLEARAEQLTGALAQLNRWIVAVMIMIPLTLLSLYLFYRLRRRNDRLFSQEREGKLEQDDAETISRLTEEEEETRERIASEGARLKAGKRRNIDNRAKIFLVNSITPLIDRMALEIEKLRKNKESEQVKADRLAYINEITDTIDEYNATLTEWIQLQQGELQLRIERFRLQELFDMMKRSRMSFRLKNISLNVEDTDAVVKADKTLTLFMLNTIADNARKFTASGGQVDISARSKDDYVEISVTDNGQGMNEEQLAGLFTHRISGGHGFGLLNCRGIIERYKKTSRLFSVCTLQAESEPGKGSRFFFRLPSGVRKAALLVLAMTWFSMPQAGAIDAPTRHAARFADSAYYSNIAGTYHQTMRFADSTRHYLQLCDHPDTSIIMGIANETAVAALALHQWDVYQQNNREYTQLYKEVTADHSLGSYVNSMQRSKQNRNVAIFMLVSLLVVIVLAYYLLYYRPQLQRRHLLEQQALADSRRRVEQKMQDVETLHDELHRREYELQQLHIDNNVTDNCLSSLKHETMYYPSRIRQLLEQDRSENGLKDVAELASYYKDLYALLARQASAQIEKPLADSDVMDYLFELIGKAAGEEPLQTEKTTGGDYVIYRTLLPRTPYREFFRPTKENIPFLVCRQIIRENSEATNRRGCGITAEPQGEGTLLTITTAKTWTTSK